MSSEGIVRNFIFPSRVSSRTLSRASDVTSLAGDSEGELDDVDCVDQTIAEVLRDEKAKPDEMDGNCYQYFCFRNFGEKHVRDAAGTLLTPPDSRSDDLVVHVGICLIIFIQVIGPLTIFASNLSHLFASYQPGAIFDYYTSQLLVVLLATAFLFCFILFAYKSTGSDMIETEKAMKLALGLKYFGQPVQPIWLVIDVVVNSWVSLSLSVCMFSVLFSEKDGIGVVFDSLSVAFLLNLDDIASDLGFLNGIWDPEKVGAFYKHCHDRGVFETAGCAGSHLDDSDKEEDGILQRSLAGAESVARENLTAVKTLMMFTFPRRIQQCTQTALLILLFVSLSAPFIFKSSAKVDNDLRDLLHGQMGALVDGNATRDEVRRLLARYARDLEY